MGYLPWPGGRGTYLRWGTYLGQGVPTFDGGTYPGWGYLPWTGRGLPTLDGGYLPQNGGTYFGWEYLLWTGYAAGGTLIAASRRRTFSFYFIYYFYLNILILPGKSHQKAKCYTACCWKLSEIGESQHGKRESSQTVSKLIE